MSDDISTPRHLTGDAVRLRDYMEVQFAEVRRQVAREIAVLVELNREHIRAHSREHEMSQVAIDKATGDTEFRFREERAFAMHHNELTQRAVDKAEAGMNERLKGMNEFRQALTDQTATLVRREYVESALNSLNTRLDERFASMETAGQARATNVSLALERAEGELSRRLDAAEKDRRGLAEADAAQERKWANLEGRMFAATTVLGLLTFIIPIVISIILKFFG